MERTFILVKPDGVKRGLVGEVIGRFEKKGFTLKGLKFTSVNRCFAKEHYADLSSKPFFQGLLDYLVSGPVVAMVWEGKNVIAISQKIKGATNPADSLPGTIRGDYAIEFDAKSMESFSNIDIWNVVHGSDAAESAEYEIGLWFPEGIVEWQSSLLPWIFE